MFTYSFIIPHHNTPDLLRRLIDTIPQREDIEIIVVDDNSDDDKKANIPRPDVKTIFIDKENTKGAGKARNVGIDAATGKWLLFADADDLYKEGFIDVLDEYKDDDIELLFYNVDSVDSKTLLPGKINRAEYIDLAIKEYNGNKTSKDYLLYDCSWVPWRKMISSKYIKRFNFQYEEVPIANDILFAFLTSYFCKKWKSTSKVLYTITYSERSLSFSKRSFEKHISLLQTKRRIAYFYKFIGHKEWNWRTPSHGFLPTSCFKYIAVEIIKNFPMGCKLLFYYLINWYKIAKQSKYYVKIIRSKQ